MAQKSDRDNTFNQTEFSFVMLEIRDSSADTLTDHFKIGYVLRGNGEISINSKEYRLSAGTLYLMTPDDSRVITVNNKVIVKEICFSNNLIDADTLRYITGAFIIDEYPSNMFDILSKETEYETPLTRRCITHILNYIMIDIANHCISQHSDSKKQLGTSIRQALRYIEMNYKTPLTLADVSAYAGFSPTYFSALFHRELSVTFKQYLTDMRLNFAVKLLLTTNLSVSDICFLSGFNNFSNFSRSFHKKLGISPMQYRKNPTENKILVAANIKPLHSSKDSYNDFETIKNNYNNTVL